MRKDKEDNSCLDISFRSNRSAMQQLSNPVKFYQAEDKWVIQATKFCPIILSNFMTIQNILICFGTRPEYIKVKSLIDNIPHAKTCFTGQHKDLLKNIFGDNLGNIAAQTTVETFKFIKEFLRFMLSRKKYWLFPILFFLILFGGLIILSQGSAIAPFIYTIF